jgi:DHA1 family bicyclomycin/chloramphenicol resistance-like MFS transporter
MNALFLVAGAQLNAHLLGALSPRRLLGIGLTTSAVAGGALLIATPFPTAGLLSVVPPLTLLMFGWGFIQSNGVALAMIDHPQVAGTAAALLGASQFIFGAAVAPLVGIGSRTTAISMGIVITACALASVMSLRLLVDSDAGSPVTAAAAEV